MPGSQHNFAGLSLCWSPKSGLAWLLYKCVALCRAVYGSSATERLLGIEEKEFVPGSGFISRRDMT